MAQPQDVTALIGSSATFVVSATGAASYQWLFNGAGIAGATSSSLTLTDVASTQAGSYSVYVASSLGAVTSNVATLTVVPVPKITSSPAMNGAVGIPFLYQITSSGQATQYAASVLPPGLTLNPATGVIAGIPTTQGNFSVSVSATDALATASASVAISVGATPSVNTYATIANGFIALGGVVGDASGNLFVTDQGNHTVSEVSPTGVITRIAGTANQAGAFDGTGAAALFNKPAGLTIDASGNLYVVDSGNASIRKVTPAGVVTTLAGFSGLTGSSDGVGNAARFNGPQGIAIDAGGNLYVTDTRNEVIRRITPQGSVTTLAGAAGQVGNGDGVGSTARFGQPTGIALDLAGNAYVMDTTNAAVRKVSPSGAVSTVASNLKFTASTVGIAPPVLLTALTALPDGTVYVAVGPYASGAYRPYPETAEVLQIAPNGGVAPLVVATSYLGGTPAPLGNQVITALWTSGAGNFFLGATSLYHLNVSPESAPTITQQPQSQQVTAGQAVTLSVQATANSPISYQWQFNGVNLTNGQTNLGLVSGAQGASLVMSNPQSGTYRVVLSVPDGSLLSSPATVAVGNAVLPPAVASAPTSQTAGLGQPVSFAVAATGAGVTYQWEKNGVPIAGATGPVYSIGSVQASDAGMYSVVAANAGGTIQTQNAALGVDLAPGAAYLQQWTAAAALPSGTLYTSASYDGSHFLVAGSDGTLRLSTDATAWAALPSAPGRLNTLVNAGAPYGIVGVGDNGIIVSFAGPDYAPVFQSSGTTNLLTGFATGSGRMVAVGVAGTALSSDFATPQWTQAVTGTTQNLDAVAFGNGRFVAVGLAGTVLTSTDGRGWTPRLLGAATDLFSVAYGPAGFVAIGNDPAGSYVFSSPDGITWNELAPLPGTYLIRLGYADGIFAAVGANGAIATSTDQGMTWTLQNSGTSATLEGVAYGAGEFVAVGQGGEVALSAPAAARLVNISTRAQVGEGSPLAAGFTASGPGTLAVLIRGIGPTLGQFGVTNPLPAPNLTLYNGRNVPVASSAAWGGSPELTAAFQQVGAFLLPDESADAAMLQVLAAGPYSAEITSGDGSAGVALAEIYDASSEAAGTSHLVNVSTLATAGLGGNALAAGFVISGNAPDTVLIRGVGPGLAFSGLTGLLSNPVLTLYDRNGTMLANNAGWGGSGSLAAVAGSVGAFALPPGSADSALLVALPPGIYSAEVSGQNATTGVALIELYEVPPVANASGF